VGAEVLNADRQTDITFCFCDFVNMPKNGMGAQVTIGGES